MEQMIAPLWATYDSQPVNSKLSVKVDSESLAVTWNVSRLHWGQEYLGTNTFQARLFRTGVIEMAYPNVVEHDGIVGIFPGHMELGRQLQHWQNRRNVAEPAVAIDSTAIYDAGSNLAFVLTMKNPVLTKIDDGTLGYRCHIDAHGRQSEFGLYITPTEPP